MPKFTTYFRTEPALPRKEWLKQRRAFRSNGTAFIASRTNAGTANVRYESGVISSGAGEQALSLLNELFERVNIGTDESPQYAIRAKYGLYSDSFISAGGLNTTE